MADIDIYTKATYPFCHRTKAPLNSKWITFNEIAIYGDNAKREVIIKRSWRTSLCRKFLSIAVTLAAAMIYMHLMLMVVLIRCFKRVWPFSEYQ